MLDVLCWFSAPIKVVFVECSDVASTDFFVIKVELFTASVLEMEVEVRALCCRNAVSEMS